MTLTAHIDVVSYDYVGPITLCGVEPRPVGRETGGRTIFRWTLHQPKCFFVFNEFDDVTAVHRLLPSNEGGCHVTFSLPPPKAMSDEFHRMDLRSTKLTKSEVLDFP